MEEWRKQLEAIKAELDAKHDEAKSKSYRWGRITTIGAVCFVLGMIIGNMLA